MKKMIFTIVLIVSIAFTGSVFAATEYNVGKICYVQANHIQPCNYWTSVAGNNNRWITWDPNQENADMMHADALVALLADKDVIVRIDNNDNSVYYDTTTIMRIKK